tara:strand:- start:8158 stop:8643 length:486 start_codon:yes stop_codon:yes gene_type:complete
MEMRELIDLIEEQQLIAELLAEKKLGKLGKAMATIGAIGSLATASPGVAGQEVAYDSPDYNKNSTSSAERAIDSERSPGEVAQYEPTVDDGRSKEVADDDVKKNAKGVLVRGNGSPLDYDSWESRVARADGMSLETTPLNKMKQAYLSYVKSVQQPGSSGM